MNDPLMKDILTKLAEESKTARGRKSRKDLNPKMGEDIIKDSTNDEDEDLIPAPVRPNE